MGSSVSGSSRVTRKHGNRALPWLSGVILLSGAALSCIPQPRPLTFNEEKISVLPPSEEVTAALSKHCRVLTTVAGVPTVQDQSFATSFRTLAGNTRECSAGGLDSWDDVRRCAGEHQAQVVQIIGRKTETTTDNRVLMAALVVANAGAGSMARGIGAHALATVSELNQLRLLDDWAQNAVQTRTVALDLRFWRCPESRAKVEPGELVWRRRQKVGDVQLDLLKDGKVVSDQEDFSNLPDLVAAYQPAFEYARTARDQDAASDRRVYVGLPFAALALAGCVVGSVGLAKHNRWLSGGGLAGGVVFTTASVWLLFDAADWHFKATTNAMNAVDSYNDNYIHHP